ncbi:TIR domain-containing protein [Bradyrhizobium sp. C-145]|uniref:TIR domain-containing protein n=1 Tax=Bradyrhizobium sp. C-145 TaxID=574727 RepID=UPI00201B7CB0|nr:TIR domain-containing protein [Bradyrhizobium sp. C-145]UQR61841.1 TIR domain-containing protein [Bradyrhizobium sp. C-145]
MARKCFYSFHYVPDNARASQVRNIGAIEGNRPAPDNDWEKVTKGGDDAIKRWIAEQMKGRTCCIVLVGSATANRKWINHEIIKAWDNGLGVVGIHIHGLKNLNGDSPFSVIDHSLKEAAPEKDWKEKARRAIKRADVVIVMVGPKTHQASGVLAEVAIARDEDKKIIQVIGYKDGNYTAVPNAGRLYSWNWDNLKKLLS